MIFYSLIVVAFVLCSGFCNSFTEIKVAVDQLPYLSQSEIAKDVDRYRDDPEMMFEVVQDARLAGLDFAAFYEVQEQFFKTMQKSSLSYQESWLDFVAPSLDYFDASRIMARQHYVQKIEIPSGSRVLLHGDLHGDVHSLVTSLAPYMKGDRGFELKEDFYLMFLGDYVDKGLYGLECIYTLMRLKVDNPDRVFFVRGNHEDFDITAYYGFQKELAIKGFTLEEIALVHRLYDILPVAIYLGCNHIFIQLCHGGLELGYLPTKLLNSDHAEYEWIRELNRLEVYSKLSEEVKEEFTPIVEAYPYTCCDHIQPVNHSTMDGWIEGRKCLNIQLGFMWTDFEVIEDLPLFYRPRGFKLNKKITYELFALTNTGPSKLLGVFRAHQHSIDSESPLMRLLLNLDNKDEENKGIAKLWSDREQTGVSLWPNIIVTFNVSPDSLAGPPSPSWPGFTFDTMGELTSAPDFNEWTLRVIRK